MMRRKHLEVIATLTALACCGCGARRTVPAAAGNYSLTKIDETDFLLTPDFPAAAARDTKLAAVPPGQTWRHITGAEQCRVLDFHKMVFPRAFRRREWRVGRRTFPRPAHGPMTI